MIEILSATEYSQWNQFVESHPMGWITHLSQWKEIIENSFPHVKGEILAIKSENNIAAGIPVYQASSWVFGDKLISIPFATISDPLIQNTQQAKILIEKILEMTADSKFRFLEIRTHLAGEILENIGIPFSVDNSYKQHLLKLDSSLDELLQSFNKRNVRKRIRQAKEKGITAKLSDRDEDLAIFYHFYFKTRKRLGLPPQPYEFLINLKKQFHEKGIFNLVVAEQHNKILGGLIFFIFKNRASAEIIAYDENYRDLHVSQLLYWQAIIEAKERGCELFDFGRTSEHNIGVMTFKNHWTRDLRDLPIYYFSKRATDFAKAREQSSLYGIFRAIGKKLPDSLFRIYGKFFYQHSA